MPDSASSIQPRPIGLMCIITTVLLGISGGFFIAPLVISLLLGCYLLLGLPVMPRPRMLYALLLAVPFALWWRYGIDDKGVYGYVPVTFLAVVGLYMMALATQHVLSARNGGSVDYALACAVMGLGLAGAAPENPLFVPLLAVFVVLMLVHLRRRLIGRRDDPERRRPAWGKYATAVLVLIGLTATLQVLLVERVPQLNEWMIRQLIRRTSTAQAGFDRTSSLSSIARVWNRGADEQVALRVFSEDPEIYLRGAVYDRYRWGMWEIVKENRPLEPTGTRAGRNVFNLYEEGTERMAATVYPARPFSDAFFVPLGTHQVAGFTDTALAGEAQTIRPEGRAAGGGYGYFPPRAEPPPPTPRDLDVPSELRVPLSRLARRVMSPDNPPNDNLRRLQRHFADHFEYRIGLNLRTDKDPIIEFLEDIRAGHCEYFASSATLMLRSIGVPARYVTGFACREQGVGDLRLARRKDAHAWVEAYLPDEGWVVFEATPPSARPEETQTTAAQRWGQWISAQWNRLVGLMLHGGLTAAVATAWDGLVNLLLRMPVGVWLAAAAAGLAWVFRENLKNAWARTRPDSTPPRVLELRRRLAAAEKMLGRHGLHRPPGTTVGSYLAQARTRIDLPDPVRVEAESLLDEYQRERFRPVDQVRNPESSASGVAIQGKK